MMDAKGVRNMQSILVVVNKHGTARVASCWFIIYYIIIYLLVLLVYGCKKKLIFHTNERTHSRTGF